MMGKRQLTQWLINRLNENSDISAFWLDKKEFTFQILWTHKSKHNWTSVEGQIFKDWAIFTNRNLMNKNENHSTWKTRMRCAFSKSKEIKELKAENHHPYKVFKIIKKDHNTKFGLKVNHFNQFNNQTTNLCIPTVVKEYEVYTDSPKDFDSIDYDIEVKIFINNELTQNKKFNTISIKSFIIIPTLYKNDLTLYKDDLSSNDFYIEMNEQPKYSKYLKPFFNILFNLHETKYLSFKKTSRFPNNSISVYCLSENSTTHLPENEFVKEQISDHSELSFIIAENPPFKYKFMKIILSLDYT